jgi:SagB-type dehydrogenase family enzyme
MLWIEPIPVSPQFCKQSTYSLSSPNINHPTGETIMESMEEQRAFLKANGWAEWSQTETDQRKGIPAPPIQKPVPDDARRIDLVAPEDLTVGRMPLIDAIRRRRSHRQFSEAPLTLEELSFLLWATQGANSPAPGGRVLRTVPSGGCRHAFETYLYVQRVEELEPGLYRYLPLEHKLCHLRAFSSEADTDPHLWRQQGFVAAGAVVFMWTAIPYRMEWRYASLSHKIIAQDSGHLCQNLYLAAEAIGAGACAVDAYEQKLVDSLIGVDGIGEFVVYVAPVGKTPEKT